MTSSRRRGAGAPDRLRRQRRWLAALAGILSAAVSLGVADLVAVVFGPRTTPVVAVGQGVIRLTPEPVKEFAIRTFGEDDKVALLVGTVILLVLFAAVAGVLAARRLAVGLAGVALLGLVAAAAALTAPTSVATDAVPSLVGAVAGAVALLLLVRRLPGRRHPAAVDLPGTAPPAAPAVPGDGARDALARRDRSGAGTDRRSFFLTAGAATGVAVVAGASGRALLTRRFDVAAARADIRLPAPDVPAPPVPPTADLEIRGLTPWRTSNADFYRVDTALVVPQVDPRDWALRIHGRVRRPLTLTYDELLARPLIERDITMTCVSNEVGGRLVGNARWLGVPLAELLEEVGVDEGADQLVGRSVEGFTIGTPTDLARTIDGAMIAVGMNGEPLPLVHGFPARMMVPGLYGYTSATKWLQELELTTFASFDPYWVKRGWAQVAAIKTSSRIDVPRPLSRPRAGQPVAVAGVAWAQTRGIAKVEVQVDDGPWQEARLAAPVNDVTWRQWSWEWTPQRAGQATLRVRAYDGDGKVQVQERAPIFPEGSSGWHSLVVLVQ